MMNVGIDCTFLMIINSIWTGLDIIRYHLEILEIKMKANGFRLYEKILLRNIFIQLQDLDELVARWNTAFYGRFLWLPVSVAITLSVAIFAIFMVIFSFLQPTMFDR